MPIVPATDIRLFKPELISQDNEAGGRNTGVPVPDNQQNALFGKVSRQARTYGDVDLVKVFAGVANADNASYAGAGLVVDQGPANDGIGILAFAGTPLDRLAEAKNRLQNYLARGPQTEMRLYGDHYQGQKRLALLLTTDQPLPAIGETYVLSTATAVNGVTEQYVRAADVRSENRVFSTILNSAEVKFTRVLVTMDLYQPLARDFAGQQAEYIPSPTPAVRLYSTAVVDAARYYGVRPMAVAAAGDRAVQVSGIFAPLVPATQSETVILDRAALPTVGAPVPAAAAAVDMVSASVNGGAPASVTFYFGRPIVPGSLEARIFRDDDPRYTMRATDRAGVLVTGVSTYNNGDGQITGGSVDYAAGRVTLLTVNGGANSYRVGLKAVPGAPLGEVTQSSTQVVTAGNRGFNWTANLTPLPGPATLTVSYRSLGRWYVLRDQGAGRLMGNTDAEGTGSVNYTTGSVAVTVGALPDLDTPLVYQWGSTENVRQVSLATVETPTFEIPYEIGTGVEPGTLSVSYLAGGAARTVTDSNGQLTGQGTGTVDYGSGSLRLRPNVLPDAGSQVTVTYKQRQTATELGTAPADNNGTLNFVLSHAPLPRQVTLATVLPRDNGGSLASQAYDDGNGKLFGRRSGVQCGTVDYNTGAVAWTPTETYQRDVYTASGDSGSWSTQTVTARFVGGATGSVSASYNYSGTLSASLNASFPVPGLVWRLTGPAQQLLVANSVLFTFAGKTYRDLAGQLQRDVAMTTDAGTAAGTVDYAAGTLTLTDWGPGGIPITTAPQLLAGLLKKGAWTVSRAAFRLDAPEVRPGSFNARATGATGLVRNGQADQNGTVTGSGVTGTVKSDIAFAELAFDVPVIASSVTYNAVAVKYLPLDPQLLGLDPIRLPQDGRVPIFRPGELVLVHHEETTALPNPVTAGTAYSLPRGKLASAVALDAAGAAVPTARYTVDLDAGTITFTDVSGLAQPLSVLDRIEDLLLLDDVQIGGALHATAALTHDYPAGALVSSYLAFGDQYARVTTRFDQTTWTGAFADTVNGSEATAAYNAANYPFGFRNDGGITERWAIVFTSATAFNVLGETLGQIATGNTSTDLAPVNPATGQPYFKILAAGWGAGWSTGNALRFNTVAAQNPVWLVRTVLSGATGNAEERFRLRQLGDVD